MSTVPTDDGEVRDVSGLVAPDDCAQVRLQMVQQLAAGLALGESPAVLYERVVDNLSVAMGVDLLIHYGIDGDHLVLRNAVGLSAGQRAELATMPIGHAVCGAVAQSGAPMWFDEVQHETNPRLNAARGLGAMTYFGVPLLHRAAIVGTVSFGSRRRSRLTLDERTYLLSVADLLAVAAAPENSSAKTVEELQRRITHLMAGLDGRTAVGRTVGMLMVAMPSNADTAFETLKYLSMNTNRKVRDVAQLIEQHFTTGMVLPVDVADALRLAVGPTPTQQSRRLPPCPPGS